MQDVQRTVSLTLERVRVALGKSRKEWSELLDVGERDYDLVAGGAKSLPITSLESAARHLGISLENFFRGEIDLPALVAMHAGENAHVRERYAVGAMSRRWSSINLLNYVEEYFGWEVRALALRHLQVQESVFATPDEQINLLFLTDLCDFLKQRG